MKQSKPVSEGGWGWLVVLSAHIATIIWDGDLKAFTVLLPSLQEQFATKTWLIGIIVATFCTTLELTGPVIGAINESNKLDPRYIGVIGGVLASVAFFAASFSTTTLQLFIFISILGGLGVGLSYMQSVSLVSYYFDKLYPRAIAIVTSGTCVGMIIFAPMTQVLLDTYGWRSSVLLLGVINAHLIVCGGLLRPVPSSYSSIESKDNESATESTSDVAKDDMEKGLPRGGRSLLSPLRIFMDPIYILHLLMFCCIAFVYSGWIIYLVPHATSKGLDPYQSVTVSMISATVSIAGRALYPPIVEREMVEVRTLMYAGSILSAVALLLDPWMENFWSITLSTSAYFLGRGVFKSLFFVILKDNLGPEHFASGFGWCLAIGGLFREAAGGIVGWLYDCTGSYNLGFLSLGVVECFGIMLLFAEGIYMKTYMRKT